MFNKIKRIVPRILLGLFFIFWAGVVACSIYIQLNGRQMVMDQLQPLFNRPVALKDVRFLFPFGLRVSDLEVEGLIKVKDLQVQMGIPDLFRKRLRLLFVSLKEPVVVFQRTPDSQIVLGSQSPLGLGTQVPTAPILLEDQTAPGLKTKAQRPLNFLVDYLVVEKGEVNFTDYTRNRDLHVTFKDLALKAQHLGIPLELPGMKTTFDIEALFFQKDFPFSDSRIQSRGWVNFYQKDLSAKLKVTEPQGKLNLSADLDAKANDMVVKGNIQIKDLSFPKDTDAQDADPQAPSFEDIIFSALHSLGVEVQADFYFKTKMDNFQVDSVSFTGNVGYHRISPST